MWFRRQWVLHRRELIRLSLLIFSGISSNLPLQADEHSTPKHVFKDVPVAVDELLSRPFGADVPLGSIGKRVWGTSPQSWGFPADVHWVAVSNLGPIDFEIRDALGPLVPGTATSFPSHVHLEGAERLFAASASFSASKNQPAHPLIKPFRPEKRWSTAGSGNRSDWYEVNLGQARTLKGLKLWFSADDDLKGCRPPARFEVQIPEGEGWKPVRLTTLTPEVPADGENSALFGPMEVSRFRVVFTHADPDYYTGLYGVEPLDADPEAAKAGRLGVPLKFSGDKYITADDCLVVNLRVQNPTQTAQVIEVTPVVDWEGQYQGRVLSNRISGGDASAPFGPWVVEAEAANRLHGFDVSTRLRFGVTSEPARPLDVFESRRFTVAVAHGREDNAEFFRKSLGFRYTIGPGETWVFRAASEIKRPEEPSALDRWLNLPSTFTRALEAKSAKLGTIAVERQESRNTLADQVVATQAWYNSNLAGFDCSDPLVRKMYYHRAYLLHKNSLEPQLGALPFATQTQGRWRSEKLAGVNSFAAAHQIREARWLADPRFWTGHLQTWTSNQQPNALYPAHIKLNGPGHGRQPDWITAAASDGYLVHPDKKLLNSLVVKLADNVRAIQKTYDPDGDGLLSLEPENPDKLERIDLTSYNFGNAQATARLYRALGEAEKANEFDELAAKLRSGVSGAMWDADSHFFHAVKAGDNTRTPAKDVTGITPFYFAMFKPGEEFNKAWTAILDPAQFWTNWPVATQSKQTPAQASPNTASNTKPPARPLEPMGPTWPHANSLVLSAMAQTLRADQTLGEQDKEKASPLTREKLWELFLSYTKAQFRNQDPANPLTGEYYHSDNGAWLTAERETNDSTWLDLLIPDLIGLVPRPDEILEINPLLPTTALTHFTLDGQRYHGHDVTVVWDSPADPADTHGDGRQGLDVYLDGKLVASSTNLDRLLIDMKTGKATAEKATKPTR